MATANVTIDPWEVVRGDNKYLDSGAWHRGTTGDTVSTDVGKPSGREVVKTRNIEIVLM